MEQFNQLAIKNKGIARAKEIVESRGWKLVAEKSMSIAGKRVSPTGAPDNLPLSNDFTEGGYQESITTYDDGDPST